MNELDAIAARGVRALFGRQFGVQLLTLAAGVVLARILQPSQFGLFFIAAFLVRAVSTLGDFGFAPSLIQRRDDLEDADLHAAFTLQLASTLLLGGVLVVGAPWIARLYPNAPSATTWLIRVLALNVVLTTWRSMGFLQLERNLEFRRVALIEVAEALSFQVVAVVLALVGAGAWSFVAATLTAGVAGTSLAGVSASRRVGILFDRRRFRTLLRYGIPYQAQMLLNSVGGWASMFLMGGLFGPRGVGLISWASANGRKPSAYFDNVTRVAFPHLSRKQDDEASMLHTTVRYLSPLVAAAVLWSLLLGVTARDLVPFVYTAKWLPAVSALITYAAALPFDTACILLVVVVNSAGAPGYVARAAFARSVGLAGLAAALGVWVGFTGFAVAHLATSALTFAILARRGGGLWVLLRSLRWLLVPTAAATAAGLAVHAMLPGVAGAILAAVVVCAVYLSIGWRVAPTWMRRSVANALTPIRIRPDSALVELAEPLA